MIVKKVIQLKLNWNFGPLNRLKWLVINVC